jgi:hypothetical protein
MTVSHTRAPTFDDVWRTIQELAQMGKETDRKFQETDRKFQETERLLKEQSQETDRLLKERSQENDRMLKALGKQLGAQGNRLGEFVQEMVRPAVVRLFRDRNLPVHQVIANQAAYNDNGQFLAEIDLLVIDTDMAVAVECKSHLSQADVDEHLERLALFKLYFPQYSMYKILGAVAAMVLPDEVGRYAYRKGLFVLAQSGDAMKIRNNDDFQPKQW